MVLFALLSVSTFVLAQEPLGAGWPTYGGDAGGLRFSNSTQINRSTLSQLHTVWTFHTHALDNIKPGIDFPSFEATPVLFGDTLYFASPYDVVFALDARTGIERWHYVPVLRPLKPDGIIASRGVALWPLTAAKEPDPTLCSRRVFLATLDAQLISLDSRTGQPCKGFGDNGSVDLRQGIEFQNIGYYGMTSPPTIIGNVVVVGSSIVDSWQVDVESGAVRGFDAINGKLLWSWEPLPWAKGQKIRTGGGNAWGVISADPALGLVYLPTGSASNDYYGGTRPGDNRDANSVVALDAATGKKVWAFQVVHHDVWDYDIASEPILFTWRGKIPAIAITTKMGMIFLLDRRTGAPLVPVQERAVPQAGAPGETLSPTQPFQNIPTLSPTQFGDVSSSTYRRSAEDEALCRQEIAKLRYDGFYTPPSIQGSLYFPGNIGGVNWGGAAIDPSTGVLYADTNRIAFSLRLVPRDDLKLAIHQAIPLLIPHLLSWQFWIVLYAFLYLGDSLRKRSFRPGAAPLVIVPLCAFCCLAVLYFQTDRIIAEYSRFHDRFGYGLSNMRKTPYYIERRPILDSHRYSCTPAPWGAITAVNLNTVTRFWEKPLGTAVPGQHTGTVNYGGPIVTASGLVFTAAAEDPWLRAFDAASGEQLLETPLPVPAQSTPMTYTLDGRQYLVIAAGGHGDGNTKLGDSLIAFTVN